MRICVWISVVSLAVGSVAVVHAQEGGTEGRSLPVFQVAGETLWGHLPAAPETVFGATAEAAQADAKGPRKVAVFVNNRGKAEFNDRVPVLEDLVIALLSGADFAPVSRDDTVQALNQFPTDTEGAANRNALGTKADRLLAEQTTALRLAQNMDTTFMVMVNITGITAKSKSLASTGTRGHLMTYSVRVNYRICEGLTGSALDGGSFAISKSTRHVERPTMDPDIVDGMLEEAAEKVTDKLSENAQKLKTQPLPKGVEILIAALPRGLQGQEISLPDLRLSEDGKLGPADVSLPVQVAATIEIDGMAAGTTPARLRIMPGMHKVRLTRPGFEPVELTINARDRLTVTPAMTMSADGFKRWREVRTFLNGLDTARKMTDAEAEKMRGYAQMLRQSGFRVDKSVQIREDTKINATEAEVEKKSIYSFD